MGLYNLYAWNHITYMHLTHRWTASILTTIDSGAECASGTDTEPRGGRVCCRAELCLSRGDERRVSRGAISASKPIRCRAGRVRCLHWHTPAGRSRVLRRRSRYLAAPSERALLGEHHVGRWVAFISGIAPTDRTLLGSDLLFRRRPSLGRMDRSSRLA